MTNVINNTDVKIAEIAAAETLTTGNEADRNDLSIRYQKVWTRGSNYHKERALTFRAQYQFVKSVGKFNLENHAEKTLGFDVKGVRNAGHKVCAMAVTGNDIHAEKDADKRKDLENKVAPVTQALDALAHFHAEHEGKSDQEFVDWWHAMGRLRGLHKAFKSPAKRDAANDQGEDGERSAAEDQAVQQAVDKIVTSPSAIEVDALPDLIAGKFAVFVAQGEGAKTRMVRLDVDDAFIASLASKVPDPLSNAPKELRFWRQLLQVTKDFVPDAVSNIPVQLLQPGEKADANTKMLPANAIVLVNQQGFSIAQSRTSDTIVVQVEPYNEIKPFLVDGHYIDTKNRLAMNRLVGASQDAAGYIKGRVSIGSDHVVQFDHASDSKLNGKLAMKPLSAMGSVWTHQVEDFSSAVDVDLPATDFQPLEQQFLSKLIKRTDDLPVTISLSATGISFQHGKATAVQFGKAGTVLASARVAQADFKRALTNLLALDLVGGLTCSLDTRGLLAIKGSTELANLTVYIQTLRDDHAPERALLKRVDRHLEANTAIAA